MSSLVLSLLCSLSAPAIVGCDGNKNQPATTTSASASGHAGWVPVPTAVASVTEAPRRKKRRPPPLVFVDGEIVGALKYGELPVGFEPTMVQRGQPFTIFNLARYIERVGVKLDEVKAVHLVGAGRTAAITGDEIRRVKDQLHFKFSREFSGAPMVDWPDDRVTATTRIDRIVALYVFAKKEAPSFDRPSKTFRWADGREVEGVPHAQSAALAGARVYLDGRLLGSLDRLRGRGGKRDGGDDEKGAEKGGDGRSDGRGEGRDPNKASHALAAFLGDLGAPIDALQAIDFVSRDDLTVGRLDAKAWGEARDALRFELAQRGQSMRMSMPASATPEPGEVDVSAVLLYSKSKPPERTVSAPKQRPGERGQGRDGMGAEGDSEPE